VSIQHISKVLDARDERLTGCRKLVLVTLANRTDAQGRCWPSQDLIAGECGITTRALRDHLQALEKDGFLRRYTKHLGQGNGSRTTYVLSLDSLIAPEEIAPEKSSAATFAPEENDTCTGSRPPITNRQEPSLIDTNVSIRRDTQISKPSKPKPQGDARGSRLPSDWLLPDDWLADARHVAFKAKLQLTDQEIRNEADKFRDFWHAKAGAAGRKLDWRATWRNWVRAYLERRPRPRNAPGGYVPDAFSQHGSSSIADAAIRRHLQRQNGNGVSDDARRGHDLSPAPDLVDAEYRLVG